MAFIETRFPTDIAYGSTGGPEYSTDIIITQSATQHTQREVTLSRESKNVDLPIVLSDQTARNIADITLYSHWMGRTGFQFELPTRYVCLEPSDVIAVTVNGITHRMRIVSTQMSTPGTLSVLAIAEDTSTFDFYNAPGTASGLLQQNNAVTESRMELLDIPALPGDDVGKGMLRVAASGLSISWTGTAIYRSDDGGTNYNRLFDMNASSVMGTAIDALGHGSVHVFDMVNNVTVSLLGDGELESTTTLAVLNGANAALLGNEVFQFTTATLVAPGKYNLSGLLRGRLGTEQEVTSHSAGERFVLLDGRIGKQASNSIINLHRSYKAVSFGSTLAGTTAKNLTYNAVALKPYAPVHISSRRDGSANITINWVRRTRLGENWMDGTDVPLNEASEAYEVDIMNGSTVVRTISAASPTVSYSAADQTTDFGSPQNPLSVRVYQISGIVGRGYAGENNI